MGAESVQKKDDILASLDVEHIDESDRAFSAWINIESRDKQGDILDAEGFSARTYMAVLHGPIMDTHTAAMVGRWDRLELKVHPKKDKKAWFGRGHIFKVEESSDDEPQYARLVNYSVWDRCWHDLVRSHESNHPLGMSIGGDPNHKASPYRECNGDVCYRRVPLTDWYETSLVRSSAGPAHPDALTVEVNKLAKATHGHGQRETIVQQPEVAGLHGVLGGEPVKNPATPGLPNDAKVPALSRPFHLGKALDSGWHLCEHPITGTMGRAIVTPNSILVWHEEGSPINADALATVVSKVPSNWLAGVTGIELLSSLPEKDSLVGRHNTGSIVLFPGAAEHARGPGFVAVHELAHGLYDALSSAERDLWRYEWNDTEFRSLSERASDSSEEGFAEAMAFLLLDPSHLDVLDESVVDLLHFLSEGGTSPDTHLPSDTFRFEAEPDSLLKGEQEESDRSSGSSIDGSAAQNGPQRFGALALSASPPTPRGAQGKHTQDFRDGGIVLQGPDGMTKAGPSEAQGRAGNYRKRHLSVAGFDISIENEKGSIRSGKNKNGKLWSNRMANDYGYIRRTEGVDGDHVDVFLGPDLGSERVFVVHQVNQESENFDEHKVIFGAKSEDEARAIYTANYEAGWKVGPVIEMSLSDFGDWLRVTDLTKAMGGWDALTAGVQRRVPDISPTDAQMASTSGLVTHGSRRYEGEALPADMAEARDPRKTTPDLDDYYPSNVSKSAVGGVMITPALDAEGYHGEVGSMGNLRVSQTNSPRGNETPQVSARNHNQTNVAPDDHDFPGDSEDSESDDMEHLLRKAGYLTKMADRNTAIMSLTYDLSSLGLGEGLAKGIAQDLAEGDGRSLRKAVRAGLIKDHTKGAGFAWDPDEENSKRPRNAAATSGNFPSPMTGEPKWRPNAEGTVTPSAHKPADGTVESDEKIPKLEEQGTNTNFPINIASPRPDIREGNKPPMAKACGCGGHTGVEKASIEKPGAGTHSDKWDRLVQHLKDEGKVDDPYAVATAQLGEESFRKGPMPGMGVEVGKMPDSTTARPVGMGGTSNTPFTKAAQPPPEDPQSKGKKAPPAIPGAGDKLGASDGGKQEKPGREAQPTDFSASQPGGQSPPKEMPQGSAPIHGDNQPGISAHPQPAGAMTPDQASSLLPGLSLLPTPGQQNILDVLTSDERDAIIQLLLGMDKAGAPSASLTTQTPGAYQPRLEQAEENATT